MVRSTLNEGTASKKRSSNEAKRSSTKEEVR